MCVFSKFFLKRSVPKGSFSLYAFLAFWPAVLNCHPMLCPPHGDGLKVSKTVRQNKCFLLLCSSARSLCYGDRQVSNAENWYQNWGIVTTNPDCTFLWCVGTMWNYLEVWAIHALEAVSRLSGWLCWKLRRPESHKNSNSEECTHLIPDVRSPLLRARLQTYRPCMHVLS